MKRIEAVDRAGHLGLVHKAESPFSSFSPYTKHQDTAAARLGLILQCESGADDEIWTGVTGKFAA